jgi:hypothetical protein
MKKKIVRIDSKKKSKLTKEARILTLTFHANASNK